MAKSVHFYSLGRMNDSYHQIGAFSPFFLLCKQHKNPYLWLNNDCEFVFPDTYL